MSIKLSTKWWTFNVCMGHEGPTFSQLAWFSITQEYYEGMTVYFARSIISLGDRA